MHRILIVSCILIGAACGSPVRESNPNSPGATENDSGASVISALDTGFRDGGVESHDSGLVMDASVMSTADAGHSPDDSGVPGQADSGATGSNDAGMSGPADPGPAVLNPGWIGGPCMTNADCSFSGGQCLQVASGYPGGMCTQSCTQFCPDQSGPLNSVTFCIDDGVASTDGMCVSRCDFTLSQTGCRQGYVCLPEKRMNQSSVVRDVCVPRTGLPNRVSPPFDIGDACVNDSDCERSSCIQGLPGGYCTQEACHIVGCPNGSSCFRLGQEEFYACIKTCSNSSQCRQSEGYQCDAQNVCWYVPPARPPCDLSGGAAACARYSSMLSNDFVVVKKSTRSLAHCQGSTEVNSYCIGLGGSPVLDKEREGDQRTPEGIFYIPRLVPNSQYYKAFLISYPDSADAARGLSAGLITQSEHDAIVSAQNSRSEPPQRTNLGGLIEIHGQGSSADWTWGCIALDNPAVDSLWMSLGIGDNVVIEP